MWPLLPVPLFASFELPFPFPFAVAFGLAVALGSPRFVCFEAFGLGALFVVLARFAPAVRLPLFFFTVDGFVVVFVASVFGAEGLVGAVCMGAVCVGADGALCSCGVPVCSGLAACSPDVEEPDAVVSVSGPPLPV